MPLPFNKKLDLKLIELVRENPILYNAKHSKYLDFDSREVVWQKIGDALTRPAAAFAGIQCQIHFEDFQEEKHKPGFIENLNEYLPSAYVGSWGIEKKLLKEYRKHQGLAPLEAKNLYIKTARALPTYGVTFFLVKEKQKDKKKLVPRLLGINAEAILRLDENTKEILQQWPLTHVKTYHVGKAETFTLDFGDYSDKDYCCKTQDAFRIRDILEGYIDLIRRRMLAKPGACAGESMAVCHDNVQTGQSHIIQHGSYQPSKIVKETFVGPSRIMAFEQGSSAQQGTQMMTMQQIIETNTMNNPQKALKGEVAHRGDMSMECVRKLKRMNSNSVKIVTLLTDPTDSNVADTQNLVTNMKEDLVVVEQGVKATADRQTIEESKKMLLDEMQDLTNYMHKLSDNTTPGHVDAREAKDAAEKIADLTTEMYFSQDPKTRRRSELLNRSKNSLIAGEKLDASIRRASFIAACATTNSGIANAAYTLGEAYKGPTLDDEEARRLESALRDRMGKLNAALALYLTSHADPNNIDYAAAINSMNAINELMPKLARDAQMLASAKDPVSRKELLEDMQSLCKATKKLCSLTGTDDHDKLQEASNKYADIAGKLIFTFARGKNADKENEIIELARDAGDKTSLLLMTANELTKQASQEEGVGEVDGAGVKCAEAARDLLACAQLTAPAIHEPHCQSALTASVEGLSSSLHHLEAAWKPMVERPGRHAMGEDLHHREMDVHKALERLRDAYGNLDVTGLDDSLPLQERQRLKFVNSLATAKNNLDGLEDQWGKISSAPGVTSAREEEARRRAPSQLAQLNAALAALAQATADRDKPDYATAELALNTIAELMPQIVKDMEVLSSGQDPATRAAMRQHAEAMCHASRDLLNNAEHLDGLGEAATKFSAASGKLVFLISPGADKGKQKMLNKLSAEAYDNAMALQSLACGFKERLPRAADELLASAAACHCAANAMLTTAQVTAPSIDDARCASALASAVANLRGCSNDLAGTCHPHLTPGSQECEDLEDSHQRLNRSLDRLEQFCQLEQMECDEPHLDVTKKKKKVQFMMSVGDAKQKLHDAAKLIDTHEPLACTMMRESDAEKLQHSLSDRLAQLNAAIAALANATADRENPDYEAAQQAMDTITAIMPTLLEDTCMLSGTKDENARQLLLQHLQQLCDATQAICDNADDPQALNEAAVNFSKASNRLTFTLSPKVDHDKEKQIIDLSSASCVRASELLSQVQALSQKLPGDAGQELDDRGARTADAAQALLTTAHVAASTISSPACSSAIISAAEHLRGSARELTGSCQPHLNPGQEKKQLDDSQKLLEDCLDDLVKACKTGPNDAPGVLSAEQKEKRRLQFVNSMSGTKSCFDDAQKQLRQPVPGAKLRQEDVSTLQKDLSNRLAQLNAAIAALANAIADREHPDYETAQQAINTITTLMPEIVQDSKALSSTKEGAAQKMLLDEVQRLCEASRLVCEDVGKGQGLSEVAAKFSNASKKLMFTITPTTNQDKQKQIIDQSSDSCGRASELLRQVQALTQQLDARVGAELDSKGANTADAAQALLAVAQVTAPSINSPQCRQVLASAVQNLRGSSIDMTNSCIPHVKSDMQKNQLENSQKELDDSLDKLLKTCGMRVVLSPQQQEKRRLQFINSLSNADLCFSNTQKLLQQPAPGVKLRQEDVSTLQHSLSDKLAQLNAAIAALANATADRENPDYTTAQQAINTINTLMPRIVQDSKALSSTKDGAEQRKLLDEVQRLSDASKHLCGDIAKGQGLSEAAAKFSDASKKLMFTITPTTDQTKQQQIIDQSSDSCVRASELLSEVQALTQQLDARVGAELDAKGANTADAAQALLAVAQVTAPSISSPQCREVLASAVQHLRESSNDMTNSCSPHVNSDSQQKQLENSQQKLEDSLDKLSKTCGMRVVLSPQQQEKRRLQYVNSLSNADHCFSDTQKLLQQPVPGGKLRQEDVSTLQHSLSDRVAQLNAAIAALANATADRENPDYTTAQQAINTITTLMPKIVQDSKALSSTKDGAEQKKLLDEVQRLSDTSKHLCEDIAKGQGLSEAAAKFSDASKKLMFTITPTTDQTKQQQIIDQSSDSCVRASELLSQVQALTATLDAGVGAELDSKGANTADAAQALLAVALVTAPSMNSPQCKHVLASAVQHLRECSNDMTDSCTPHVKSDSQKKQLESCQQQLEDSLDKLLKSCGMRVILSPQQQEKRRLQFVNSLSKADHCFSDVQKLLQQPAPGGKLRQEDVSTLQHSLSDRLAQLNAAIAALANATADRVHPDYATAQQSMNTITTLMPAIVQDSKILSTCKDGADQKKLLDEVKRLCDASKNLCEDVRQGQGLSEAAAKFSDASKNLMFTIAPTTDQVKQKQIIDQSSDSCVRASELLSEVQALTATLDAGVGAELDSKGANTADAAQALLAVAQVTSSSPSSPQCRSELVSAAQTLRSSAADLVHACTPHVKRGAQEKQLKHYQVQLDTSLDRLLETCMDGYSVSPEQREKQRVKFMHSVSTVSNHLDDAQKQLQQPLVRSSQSQSDSPAVHHRLCRHLAQLNAAVAALTSATMDYKQPNYPTAERSIITITELMPVIVQESQTLSCSQDDDSQTLIQHNLKELCEAARRICDNADDPKKLNEASFKLAMTSNKLLDIVRTEDATQGAKGKGPGVPVRSKPVVPVRRSSVSATKAVPSRHSDATHHFLDALRNEEAQDRIVAEEAKHLAQSRTDEDKCALNEYCNVVDDALKELKQAQEHLQVLYSARHTPVAVDAVEIAAKEQTMEDSLAQAAVQVAALVDANYADKLDYKAAMEPTIALTKAVKSAVDDGSMVSSILYSDTRKNFIQDMMGLCHATSDICEAAKNEQTKVNDAVIAFGNQSAKLLRVVSAGHNEMEVINRAKSIGDSASRLALEASSVANSANDTNDDRREPSHVPDICTAGAQCVDAAGKLVYTAKLVAPTMHHSTCQEAILSSADALSSKLTTFSNTWRPLPSDPHTEKLTAEARNLERLLEKLKNAVKKGYLGKRRVEPRIVLDTPLKRMTLQIMENAKNIWEHSDLPSEVRQEYKKYCNSLEEALRALDIANARCQRAPYDKTRRNELEIASQDLQMITLQSRPARAGQQINNIVDFRDFLQGLVTESEELQKTADKNQAAIGKKVTDDIKLLCTKINEDATRLMDPPQVSGNDGMEEYEDIDLFGQECDGITKDLSAMVRNVPDQKARTALQAKLLMLIENCHLLRYATNSAKAMARSAALDAALTDLNDVQSVLRPLVTYIKEKEITQESSPSPPASAMSAALSAVRACARAGRGAHAQTQSASLSSAAALYCFERAVQAPPSQANKMQYILQDMLNSTSLIAEESSCRAYNWQLADDHSSRSGNRHVHEILKGIDRLDRLVYKQPEQQVLKEEDLNRLLSSSYRTVEGTRSQLEDKFSSLCTKVTSMSGSIFPSIKKAESLGRSLHATADAALQLADVSTSLKDDKNPVQSKKIEDATHEMCLSTYSLLKTAEHVSHNPNHPETRRRLMETCRELNNAINDLSRAVQPMSSVPRECAELLLGLSLQRAALALPPLAVAAAPYHHCIEALQSQTDVLLKLNSDQSMSREEFLKSMLFITTAVGNSTDHAAHATYLLSVSEKDKDAALEGLVDVPKMNKTIAALQDTCLDIVMHGTTEKSKNLEKQADELLKDLDEGVQKTKNEKMRVALRECRREVESAAKTLYAAIRENKHTTTIEYLTLSLSERLRHLSGVLESPALVAAAGDLSPAARAMCDDVLKHSTDLVSNTQELIKEIKQHPEHSQQMKWSTFNKRREVLASFDALLKSIKLNGQNANILEAEEEDTEQKSYVQIQTDTAFKWLHKPMAKSDTKANGQQAVRNLIDVGNKMLEDLSGGDKEDLRHLVEETEQLLVHCSKKYDQEQYSLLMERIRELQKAIQRVAVTRVVEDFMEIDEPLASHADMFIGLDEDPKNRKFQLERKIAELLAQLGRVKRTARFIADTGSGGRKMSTELRTCSEQTELIAHKLVKAAEERMSKPDNASVADKYTSVLSEYTSWLAKVRDLCDRAVEPMDFVQTAGDTMQRLRDDAKDHDVMKCAVASAAITKLANRVIHVGLSSRSARNDPELQHALTVAKQQLSDATPPHDTRASRMPDWRDTTAKILRTTEEVESVLGGENIFKKQPDTNQPIYNEALNLHVAIRDWSSRDNEIVAVAKRMAVLMAKLSDFMNTDKQREVLTTSKSIVSESHEVARLAKKLAHECSDHRIKTNLLQVCERIPTISGQLKMLTTVKGSSLGHHGTQEDKEAMDMLVGNAQSLMISIQDVVKAAASASVKIMSQRGPKIKWVRKTYY